MDSKTEAEILHELKEDKKNLEDLFSREIKAFAVPFDYYSALIEDCVKKSGFEYARIPEESLSFKLQTDYHRWKATIFHNDSALEKTVQKFIDTNEELALFQIVGHSYDLDIENLWDKIENIARQISLQDDILPITTIEIIDYLKAMNKAEITENDIINNSEKSLWFLINETVYEVKLKSRLKSNKHNK